MKPMEFPRWQVDVTVNGEVVRSFHETATTSKAAVAKAKRKMRGAVSNAGAFKFTAKREGSAHATKTPTAEQLAALRTFANDNGRNWKSALNRAWSTGDWSHDYADNSGLLQQVRNQFGPRWLVKFTLPREAHATKKSKAQLDREIAASLHKKHGTSCGCPHAHSTIASYRVAYGTSGGGRTFRDYDPNTFTTLEAAAKRRRVYKRNGFWSWIEDTHGTFVPVEGAKNSKVQKHYPVR